MPTQRLPLHEMHAEDGLTYQLWRGPAVSDEDVAQMGSVLLAAFGSWPAFELPPEVSVTDHLRWKLEGQAGAPGYVQIVREPDRIVAQNIGVVLDHFADRESMRVLLGCDSGVLPSHQGRGINGTRQAFARKHLDADTDIELTYSTNPVIIRQDRRRGRRELGNPPIALFRPLDDGRVAENLARRRGRLPPTAWRMLMRAQRAREKARWKSFRALSTGDWRVTSVDRFDGLSRAAIEPFRLAGTRSAAYLNWRVADPRAGEFEVLAAEEGDRLLGFIVTKLSGERGHVADVLVQPGRLDVLAGLVEAALELLRVRGAYGVAAWLPWRHPYVPVLRHLGFVIASRETGISFRVPGDEGDKHHELAYLDDDSCSIHLTLLDSDVI